MTLSKAAEHLAEHPGAKIMLDHSEHGPVRLVLIGAVSRFKIGEFGIQKPGEMGCCSLIDFECREAENWRLEQ